MPIPSMSQRSKLRDLFADHGILRAYDIRAAGISAQTIARAVAEGELSRISRGLYQHRESDIEEHQNIAEAASLVTKGVIALTSVLAFHGLTDQMPRRIWVAIGASDWAPTVTYPPLRIVRFTEPYLRQGIEHHAIAGVQVPIYSITKTLADLFRNPKLVDRSVAIEGLRAALEQRKARPAEIADAAQTGGAWRTMRPYLEALTSNG